MRRKRRKREGRRKKKTRKNSEDQNFDIVLRIRNRIEYFLIRIIDTQTYK